jgi:hypothetical protein
MKGTQRRDRKKGIRREGKGKGDLQFIFVFLGVERNFGVRNAVGNTLEFLYKLHFLRLFFVLTRGA